VVSGRFGRVLSWDGNSEPEEQREGADGLGDEKPPFGGAGAACNVFSIFRRGKKRREGESAYYVVQGDKSLER